MPNGTSRTAYPMGQANQGLQDPQPEEIFFKVYRAQKESVGVAHEQIIQQRTIC